MDFELPSEQTTAEADIALAPPVSPLSHNHRTLAKAFTCAGTAIHSGKHITMQALPANAKHGIVFQRTDIADKNKSFIKAHYDNVDESRFRTRLVNEFGITVSTVEHICSALMAFGINNALIKLNGDEVPSMDGSSLEFSHLITKSNIREFDEPCTAIKITSPIEIKHGDSYCGFKVSTQRLFSLTLDYNKGEIGKQSFDFDLDSDDFAGDIASARTFGFRDELKGLQAAGLAFGASERNTVVLNDSGVENPESLRFDNELVRHKILDAIGDIALANKPIIGHFYGYKSGHALNNQLLRKLFSDTKHFVTL